MTTDALSVCVCLSPSVGEVSFVELFEDESGKPRGCGFIEFERAEHARVALDKMHRFELKGRKLVVKEVRILRPTYVFVFTFFM